MDIQVQNQIDEMLAPVSCADKEVVSFTSSKNTNIDSVRDQDCRDRETRRSRYRDKNGNKTDILAESKGSFLNKYILESTPLRVYCAFYIRYIRGTFLCF